MLLKGSFDVYSFRDGQVSTEMIPKEGITCHRFIKHSNILIWIRNLSLTSLGSALVVHSLVVVYYDNMARNRKAGDRKIYIQEA